MNFFKPLVAGGVIAALGLGTMAISATAPSAAASSVITPSSSLPGYLTATTELRDPPLPQGESAATPLAVFPAAARRTVQATWSRTVWATGGQAQIDQCRGLVQVKFSRNRSVVAQHNYCGGAWILQVKPGQTVKLTGKVKGIYRAVRTKVITLGATAKVLNGMSRSGIVLQTCYFNSSKMRLVGLERIA